MVAVESCACLRLLSSATTDGTILCVSFCLLRSVLSVMSAATVVLSLSLSLSLSTAPLSRQEPLQRIIDDSLLEHCTFSTQ